MFEKKLYNNLFVELSWLFSLQIYILSDSWNKVSYVGLSILMTIP